MNDKVLKDKTALATIAAIILVLPSFIPAALAVFIYTYFLKVYVSGHWIPYLEEISLLWFPELMRGLIVGAVTMGITKWLFKKFNTRVIRYAVIAFWGAIILSLIAFNISMYGLNLDLIGALALLFGLGLGLFIDELESR
jgi:hypothetical protein